MGWGVTWLMLVQPAVPSHAKMSTPQHRPLSSGRRCPQRRDTCSASRGALMLHMMPLNLIRKIRNSELNVPDNRASNCQVLADGNQQKVKLRKFRLIKPSEVNDCPSIPYGVENETPWETITNGIYKKDMPGMWQKTHNGYQYELSNKFPLQY